MHLYKACTLMSPKIQLINCLPVRRLLTSQSYGWHCKGFRLSDSRLCWRRPFPKKMAIGPDWPWYWSTTLQTTNCLVVSSVTLLVWLLGSSHSKIHWESMKPIIWRWRYTTRLFSRYSLIKWWNLFYLLSRFNQRPNKVRNRVITGTPTFVSRFPTTVFSSRHSAMDFHLSGSW